MTWGADLARTVPRSVPPATSPECRAMVADAEAAARYVATVGMKIRAATVEESEAARYARPSTPGVDPLPGPLPPGWETPGGHRTRGGSAPRPDGVIDPYQAADLFVELYVSAGPADSNGSCDAENDANCVLYRVVWNLPRGELVAMERVDADSGAGAGTMGEVQPGLSPDESEVAWIRRFRGDGGEVRRELVVRRRDSAAVVAVPAAKDGPEFPNWYSNKVLLYHQPSDPAGDDPTTRDDNMSTLWAWAGGAAPVPVLGEGSSHGRRKSYQDADTHADPAYRKEAGPRIVTFGGEQGKKQPRVTGLHGGEEETFALGFRNDDDQCHHPAWNIEGDRILCHRNEPRENLGGDQYLRGLFEYAYTPLTASGGGASGVVATWKLSTTSAGSGGRVFDPKTPEQLQGWFPAFSATECVDYFYKYAEWCGTDDYVLATVYCKDGSGAVLSSRVIIVHLRETEFLSGGTRPGGTRYSDVTGAMEQAASVPDRSWRGIFGTCSSARSLLYGRTREVR